MKEKPLFISYASQDRDIAFHVLSFLEGRGECCWIAARDILPSADWAESIIDGIDAASGLVLLVSRHSNESPQVRREVERAVDKGIPVFPLFLERVQLSKWMQYYISPHQWSDASDVSLGTRLGELVQAVQSRHYDSCNDIASITAMLEVDLSRVSAALDSSEDTPDRLFPGEMRGVSALFTVTGLPGRDTPPSARAAAVATVENLLQRYAMFYGGRLQQVSQTCHRLIFGEERVQENDDKRALECAVALLEGFRRLYSVLSGKGFGFEFGLGIATGTAWVEEDSSVRGGVLLLARELAESASGELLVTDSFHRQVRSGCAFEEHAAGVYRMVDSGALPPGFRTLSTLSPFVGRGEEISRLVSLPERQRESEKHLVMTISGDAGIGKSRLVHQFISQHCDESIAVLKGQTLSFAQPPRWAWASLLREHLEVEHGSSIDYPEFLERLEDSPRLAASAPFLASLLSIPCPDERLPQLDEKAVALETSIAFRNLLECLSERKRLVVILEDCHWLGGEDQKILRFVIENCTTERPVVFILVYRPEREDGSAFEFSVSSAFAVCESIELKEVSDTVSECLVRALLEREAHGRTIPVAPNALGFLLEHSRGNPFYLEELVFDLVERKVLAEENGRWMLQASSNRIHVPESLTGLIQSRLQRLPGSWKKVLQNSSVLGTEFQLRLYWKLVGKLFLNRCHPDVFLGLERKQMLHSMQKSEFDIRYAFRHILVHHTAYSSILEPNLKKLHRAAAEAILELFPGESDMVSGILMHHYEKAGERGPAIHWGLKALSLHMGQEALEISQRLEGLLEAEYSDEQLDQGIFKMLSYREKAEDLQADREGQQKTIERMLSIALRTGSHLFMAIALKKQGALARVTGTMNEARAHIEKALEHARAAGDRAFEGIVLGNLGTIDTLMGVTESARSFFESALEIHREVGDLRSEGIILMNLGILHKHHGRWQEARSHYDQALETAKKVGDRRSEADILSNTGSLIWTMGFPGKAGEFYQRSLEIQNEIGNRRSMGILLSNIALLHMNAGRFEEALENYEKALSIAREAGDVFIEGQILGNLGVLYSNHEMFEEATAQYEKAMEIQRRVGNRVREAISISNIGNIHLKQGRLHSARTNYEKAVLTFREQDSRENLAGTLSSLGRLHLMEGDPTTAGELFLEAFGIITELGLGNNNLDGFNELHAELSAVGQCVPWPGHWDPPAVK